MGRTWHRGLLFQSEDYGQVAGWAHLFASLHKKGCPTSPRIWEKWEQWVKSAQIGSCPGPAHDVRPRLYSHFSQTGEKWGTPANTTLPKSTVRLVNSFPREAARINGSESGRCC